MVPFSDADFLVWIDVLGAGVWIGGRIALGMVMPMPRSTPDVRSSLSRGTSCAYVAWPSGHNNVLIALRSSIAR